MQLKKNKEVIAEIHEEKEEHRQHSTLWVEYVHFLNWKETRNR